VKVRERIIDCFPPHDRDPDDHELSRPFDVPRVPTWLFVIGLLAILAYVLFFIRSELTPLLVTTD
jgi:hypothetical protein